MDKKFMHTIIPVTDGQKVYVSTLKIQKSKYQSKKLPLVTKTINLSKEPIIFLAKRKRVDMRNKLYQSDDQKNHEHYSIRQIDKKFMFSL